MSPTPASARRRPPDRRLSETRRIEHRRADGSTSRVFVTIGYEADDPLRPVEVFYSEGFKSGSELEFTIQDACILISLLLQHGIAPDRIAGSLSTRETAEGGTDAGSLAGTIAAELARSPTWDDIAIGVVSRSDGDMGGSGAGGQDAAPSDGLKGMR